MGWFSRKSKAEGPATLASVRTVAESSGATVRNLDGAKFTFPNGEVPIIVVEGNDAVSIGSFVRTSTDFDNARSWVTEFNGENMAPTMFVQEVTIDGRPETVVCAEFRILRRIDFTEEQLNYMVQIGLDTVSHGLLEYLESHA